MIKINNSTIYSNNYKSYRYNQSFKADASQQQYKNSLTYEQSVINTWTGLGIIAFAIIGFFIPNIHGTNKEVMGKLLTRNLPAGIAGGIIGALIGAGAGKNRAKEHRLLVEELSNVQNIPQNSQNQKIVV